MPNDKKTKGFTLIEVIETQKYMYTLALLKT